MRIVAVVLCSAALTLPITWLSRAPYSPPDSAAARLRLSWRMDVTTKENCRPRTQQELDALPVHMRTPEVCTRDVASYTMLSRIDEQPADTVQLTRAGVRADRPLFVLRERALSAGEHRVRIAVVRTTADAAASTLVSLDTVLVLEPGMVQLVTMDDGMRRLVVRSSGSRQER